MLCYQFIADYLTYLHEGSYTSLLLHTALTSSDASASVAPHRFRRARGSPERHQLSNAGIE